MLYRVDIDGTICITQGMDYEHAVSIPSAIQRINALYDNGHTVIYWTSRGVGSGKDYYALTLHQLQAWGCKFHQLECNKPVFDVLYDDKAHSSIPITSPTDDSSSRVIILIPARGGSKGLPRKNVRCYDGEPLLCHSIRYGLRYSRDVYVSTEDDTIATLAQSMGARVISRPLALSGDEVDDLPVFQHACSVLGLQRHDILVHLRPTSPDRPAGLIEQALALLQKDSRITAVRTVSPCEHKEALKSFTLDVTDHLRLQPLCHRVNHILEPFNQPRQKLPQVYNSNGYLDVVYVRTVLEQQSMTGTHLAALITPPEASDIDVLQDWQTGDNKEQYCTVTLGSQPVGLDYPTFVIAEIGINHNGSLEEAMYLIREAAQAGAQCVKLQKRDLSTLFTQRALDRPYVSPHAFGNTYGEHKKYLELGLCEYLTLQRYAQSLGLHFTASVWDKASVDFLETIAVPFYKIPSAAFMNWPLLEYVCSKGKPLMLSCGMSTAAHIEEIMRRLSQCPYKVPVILLHCTSTYPTITQQLQLKHIRRLRQTYPQVVVGFSCHTPDPLIPLAAVSLGASVLEIHLTRKRQSKGSDHHASLEPAAFKSMIQNVRMLEIAFGDGSKFITTEEQRMLEKLGMSVCSTQPLVKGTVLTKEMVCIKTDLAYGLNPLELERFMGKKLACDVPSDVCLQSTYFEADEEAEDAEAPQDETEAATTGI